MRNDIVSHRHVRFLLMGIVLAIYSPAGHAADQETIRYVGSEACKDCHENEYLYFMTYARKSTSFRSIERLKKELSEQEIKGCYACHTTGYGKDGGFESPDKTPHLRNAGCEVCHGPGGYHVKTQDAKHIKGSLTARDCEVCHTSERINAFRYKPLIHGGAH
jgi:hypothetical protein